MVGKLGTLHGVGVGPGDPELLTVKAARLIGNAPVIAYLTANGKDSTARDIAILSRAVMRNIRQNLIFAFVYNVAGVPVAAWALYPLFGLLLSPQLAAGAMALSSVSVIGNALRQIGRAHV